VVSGELVEAAAAATAELASVAEALLTDATPAILPVALRLPGSSLMALVDVCRFNSYD